MGNVISGVLERHMWAHHFDYEFGKKKSRPLASDALESAHSADMERLFSHLNSESYTYSDMGREVSKKVCPDGPYADDPGISDFISALTKNRIVGYFWHPTNYYRALVWQRKEMFANLVEVYGRGDDIVWHFLQESAPIVTQAFIDILEDGDEPDV